MTPPLTFIVFGLALFCAGIAARATDATAFCSIHSYSKTVTTELEANPTLTEGLEFDDEIVLPGSPAGASYPFVLGARCLLTDDVGSVTAGCRISVDVDLEFPDGIPSSVRSGGFSMVDPMAALDLSGGKIGEAFPFDYQMVRRAERSGTTLVIAADYSTVIDRNTAHMTGAMEASHVRSGVATIWLNTNFHVVVYEDTRVRIKGSLKSGIRGRSQFFPLLPAAPNTFLGAPSGGWIDPPMATGFEFTMTGSSLFTKILGFPRALDGDRTFRVWSENQLIGSFTEDQTVDFQALLGHPVANFRVTGINPTVDAASETAFPIQLEYDTAHADLTMVPIPAPFISLTKPMNGEFEVVFDGTLQSSSDLKSWLSLPQAISPYKVKIVPGAAMFFRASKPD